MDQEPRGRKLAIGAGGVAAFVGFMALTSWTSSDADDDQRDQDMAIFCQVVSSTESYATLLQVAGATGGFGGGGGTDPQTQTARFLADALVERAPEEYVDQADRAVEGLDRALRGELDSFDAQEYIADFEQLAVDSSEDCAPFAGEEGDIGLLPGSEETDGGFGGEGGDGGDGGFGTDDGGGFGGGG